MSRPLCSLETANMLLAYDAVSGLIRWRQDRKPNIKAGTIAGTFNSHGYVQICINGRMHLGHRLAWLLTHGQWPLKMIDHINGDPADNRLVNLREATSSQNQANRGARKDSANGMRGVRFHPSTGKWSASIQIGSFTTAEEAQAAYLKMAEICYGEFSPSRRMSAQSHAARILGSQDRT